LHRAGRDGAKMGKDADSPLNLQPHESESVDAFFRRRSPFEVRLWKTASYAISTRFEFFLTIRGLARHVHPRLHPSRRLRFGPRPHTQNLDLHSPIQPQCSAVPVDVHQPEETHPCVTFFGYATLVGAGGLSKLKLSQPTLSNGTWTTHAVQSANLHLGSE
jgi:hypothetical protein